MSRVNIADLGAAVARVYPDEGFVGAAVAHVEADMVDLGAAVARAC